tara:strand:+ start:425 stop:1000 length:576 start_codon:yes stop_codon:yes gene_type:complete
MKLKSTLEQSIKIKKKLIKLEKKIFSCINLISNTLKNGNKVLICGNGGSAADAQHLAAEFMIRLRPNVSRKPYPVITLAQDTSTITACGNDLGFDNLFSRNLESLGKKGDTLIVISTSGNSKNIYKVLKKSKTMNLSSISLLGSRGGICKGLANLELVVESNITARIQECHIFLGHFIFEKVEDILIKKSN